jgi:hypothetical protein
MCLHNQVRFDAEKDNYYCTACHGGMGLAYYKAARERDALKAAAVVKDGALRVARGGFEYLSNRINATAYIREINEALAAQPTP